MINVTKMHLHQSNTIFTLEKQKIDDLKSLRRCTPSMKVTNQFFSIQDQAWLNHYLVIASQTVAEINPEGGLPHSKKQICLVKNVYTLCLK